MKFNTYRVKISAELVLTENERRIIRQCCSVHYDHDVQKFARVPTVLKLSLENARLLDRALSTGIDVLDDDDLQGLNNLRTSLQRVITNLTRRLCHAETRI